MTPRCPDCGRYHNQRAGCSNHDDPRTGYPTVPNHGHTIREGQPRVREQISRQMRCKSR